MYVEDDEEATTLPQPPLPSLTLLDDEAGAPAVGEATEVVPTMDGVHERMLRSARTTNAMPTASTGARARARSIIRHITGQPIKLKPHMVKGAAKKHLRLPIIEESREARLRNRNARKEEINLKLAEASNGQLQNDIPDRELADSRMEAMIEMTHDDCETDETSGMVGEVKRSEVVEVCE